MKINNYFNDEIISGKDTSYANQNIYKEWYITNKMPVTRVLNGAYA
jgi:hypothetical protein